MVGPAQGDEGCRAVTGHGDPDRCDVLGPEATWQELDGVGHLVAIGVDDADRTAQFVRDPQFGAVRGQGKAPRSVAGDDVGRQLPTGGIDDMNHVGDLGRHVDPFARRIDQDALGFGADLDGGQSRQFRGFPVLAFVFFLFLFVLAGEQGTLGFGFGHTQVGHPLAFGEVGRQIEDAEPGVVFQGKIEGFAIGAQVKGFRIVDARDPVDQFQVLDVNDVDGIAIAAGYENAAAVRGEL